MNLPYGFQVVGIRQPDGTYRTTVTAPRQFGGPVTLDMNKFFPRSVMMDKIKKLSDELNTLQKYGMKYDIYGSASNNTVRFFKPNDSANMIYDLASGLYNIGGRASGLPRPEYNGFVWLRTGPETMMLSTNRNIIAKQIVHRGVDNQIIGYDWSFPEDRVTTVNPLYQYCYDPTAHWSCADPNNPYKSWCLANVQSKLNQYNVPASQRNRWHFCSSIHQ